MLADCCIEIRAVSVGHVLSLGLNLGQMKRGNRDYGV
jgi:hypothetical protein